MPGGLVGRTLACFAVARVNAPMWEGIALANDLLKAILVS